MGRPRKYEGESTSAQRKAASRDALAARGGHVVSLPLEADQAAALEEIREREGLPSRVEAARLAIMRTTRRR